MTSFLTFICWSTPSDTSKNIICLSVADISVSLQPLRAHRAPPWSFAAHHLLNYIWGYCKSSDSWPVISNFLFSISFLLFLFSRSFSSYSLAFSFSSVLTKLPVLCHWGISASGLCSHCRDDTQEEKKISSKGVLWETLLVNSLLRVAPHLTVY